MLKELLMAQRWVGLVTRKRAWMPEIVALVLVGVPDLSESSADPSRISAV